MSQHNQKLLLITGPGGAGRSTAIRVLEDLGFEAIDNLPLSLLPRLVQGPDLTRPMALGIDSRNREFDAATVLELYRDLTERPDLDVQLVFLDCDDDVLLRRYSETRRRHPLALEASPLDGIRRDRDLMAPIRSVADVLIDTSELSVHDLRDRIEHFFAPESGRVLAVQIQSFSYKRGLPQGLDMVLDVRFLQNPHWDQALRPLDGRDAPVAEYVARDDLFEPFVQRIDDLLDLLLPAYRDEGKAHFSLGFGCTGGRHRSVALAELFGKRLAQRGWHVSVRHREMERLPPPAKKMAS